VLLGVTDPALALDFDFAIAYVGAKFDAELDKEVMRRSKMGANTPAGDNGEVDFWRTVNKVRLAKGLPPALKRRKPRG